MDLLYFDFSCFFVFAKTQPWLCVQMLATSVEKIEVPSQPRPQLSFRPNVGNLGTFGNICEHLGTWVQSCHG